MRNICYVITEMLEELVKFEKYYSDVVLLENIKFKLNTNRERAKMTAPEAMFLRWQELDDIMESFMQHQWRQVAHANDFISAYLGKWE